MKIEPTRFAQWTEAYRCIHGPLELIVVTEIGPRIMSLRRGDGKNILYEDHTGLSYNDWHIYGGHRFLTAPESMESYEPDNDRCKAVINGSTLRITRPTGRNGLIKILEIESQGEGFEIRHILRNPSPFMWHGAPWPLTCIQPCGQLIVPWGSGSGQWRTNKAVYWDRVGEEPFAVATPQWRPGNELFAVEPSGETGKVGLYTDRGWLAWLRPDGTFVIRFAPIAPEVACPDSGCNVEIYTCKDFVEMETLGGMDTLYPGSERVHTEQWLLTEKVFTPERWREIESL